MLRATDLRVDYFDLNGNNKVIQSKKPVISWGAITDTDNDFQECYHIKVKCGNDILWDSGIVNLKTPFALYDGKDIPTGKRIDLSVSIAGNDKIMSDFTDNFFYLGSFDNIPEAKWICSSKDKESVPSYFKRKFTVLKKVTDAVMYISGVGYNIALINDKKISAGHLNPPVSDYEKSCYYCVFPEISDNIKIGENEIKVIVADGWRRNNGDYLKIYKNSPSFFGTPMLWSALYLEYEDGSNEWIYTDENWSCSYGNITFSHIFDGETFDATIKESENYPVKLFDGQTGKLKPMILPYIDEYKTFEPISITNIDKGKYIVDFGTNLSGVLKIKIPDNIKRGEKIILRHSQLLNDDGTLNQDNLRGAMCEDTYIASGDNNDLNYWQPEFTYHGFRYAEISGIPLVSKDDVTAIMICTPLNSTNSFYCGNAVINRCHEITVQTERSTIHSAFNDTCGRSERLFWLNDGMARFGEVAYNFEISRIFPHVISLICDSQNEDGSITDTIPHVYGRRPADPAASSYLVLADELYKKTGNINIIKEYYDSMCKWQNCLINNSENLIMNYTYVGDWAGPEYSRDKNTMGGGAGSKTIPPIMVGTAIFINNFALLKKFAKILNKDEDYEYYNKLHIKAKNAFLDKWYDKKTNKIYNGSQSCQSIALWANIIPEEDRAKVAKIMRDDLVDSGYMFTTASICTNHLLKVLAEYGYIDEFYEFMSREEYPSLGYMIQCGATTTWEKFEYLTGNNMNAHIHPAQGGILQNAYKYIGGISPTDIFKNEYEIKPYYPKKLLTSSIVYKTVMGDLSVNWRKINNKINLLVSVPFNTKANIHTKDGIKSVGSGLHSYTWDI